MQVVNWQERRELEKKHVSLSVLIPLWFCAVLWLIQFIQWVWNFDFGVLGIAPRTLSGLKGILFGPLLHGSWGHLASNTLPLLVLGFMMIYFYHSIAYRVISLIWLFDGIGVWLIGRDSFHLGASGLIYGMASFLFFSGMMRKNRRLLAVALVIVFVYGSMVWGMLPVITDVSWEAHLAGFLSGIALAVYYRRLGPLDDAEPEWMQEEEEEKSETETGESPDTSQQNWSNEIPVFRNYNTRDEESD
jgi:membrane associated rhomboid family serine protease